ncbi:hypothetical protein BKA00_002879 [Actinomadura coerulea]|uniref:Uncharacterized protein n=1 Tax=Actinomadura coerulea TaxID=46159 RepID=A0A7X0FZJ9_9ACTN|nr:hypothetical protein [Actinomadura coerulea]MBB6395965.1 hypothetical protein [Actinomadura coerulea]GGQ30649.1 hypothetical protein GCM10010187_54410 [Actinomadura coerulea]
MNYSAVRIGEANILALRSFLLEGPEAWVPLQDEMQVDDETAAGYMSLLFCAFEVAVRRKFAPTYIVGQLVRFVADVRIAAGEDANLINPLIAEDMVRRAVDAPPLKETVPDDVSATLHAQVFILLYLVAEMDLDRAGLEQFIDEVTSYTEQWLAARRAEASTSAS